MAAEMIIRLVDGSDSGLSPANDIPQPNEVPTVGSIRPRLPDPSPPLPTQNDIDRESVAAVAGEKLYSGESVFIESMEEFTRRLETAIYSTARPVKTPIAESQHPKTEGVTKAKDAVPQVIPPKPEQNRPPTTVAEVGQIVADKAMEYERHTAETNRLLGVIADHSGESHSSNENESKSTESQPSFATRISNRIVNRIGGSKTVQRIARSKTVQRIASKAKSMASNAFRKTRIGRAVANSKVGRAIGSQVAGAGARLVGTVVGTGVRVAGAAAATGTATASGTGAAGVAGVGAAGVGAAGIAGVAAVAAPAAIAIGAFTAAVMVATEGLKQLADGTVADQIEPYSGDVALARARRRANTEINMVDRAKTVGGAVGSIETAKAGFSNATERLWTRVLEALSPLVVVMGKLVDVGTLQVVSAEKALNAHNLNVATLQAAAAKLTPGDEDDKAAQANFDEMWRRQEKTNTALTEAMNRLLGIDPKINDPFDEEMKKLFTLGDK